MKLRFLGTNGWYSTNTGNTISVLIETQKFFVVFDAGDGIYKLDKYLTSEAPIYLFLSHFHFDHIYGLHTFAKFKFKNPLTIFGQPGIRKALEKIICHPYTVPFEELKIKVNYQELEEGKHDQPQTPFPIECRYLAHSDPCFGYRLKLDKRTVAYCVDTGICDNMIRLSKEADVLIAESTYKIDEAIPKSWSHLNPKDAATIAKKAKAKKLFLVHFNASCYSSLEDKREAENIAKTIFSETTVCFDDMRVDI